MKLTEMRELLAARGIRLTRSLGQSFLHDANQLRRIVAAAELSKSDKVFEIGPGLGPLTELLLAKGGEVLAIEKDARLVEILRERICKSQSAACDLRFELLHDDALDYLRREPRDWSAWKLVANLPYSVASPILVELAKFPRRPARMVVTLQLEVARRLMAKPGDADYGVLTLLVQADYVPGEWFKIPAGCFFPAPDVDSACVVLVRRDRSPLTEIQRQVFARIVKRAFSERRKMMLKLLKQDWPADALRAAFDVMNIPPHERAEKLSLDQFVRLTRMLTSEK